MFHRSLALIAAVALATSSAKGQQHDHGKADPSALAPLGVGKTGVPSADAVKAFDLIKSLAGAWHGQINDPFSGLKAEINVMLRVASRGTSVVHEMKDNAGDTDPIKKDHPVTMIYMDGDKLTLIMYCDAGNRPRMIGRISPDGKTVDFDFADLSGPATNGNMTHATFTFIDANHHTEAWSYKLPNGKEVTAKGDLYRTADRATVVGQ